MSKNSIFLTIYVVCTNGIVAGLLVRFGPWYWVPWLVLCVVSGLSLGKMLHQTTEEK